MATTNATASYETPMALLRRLAPTVGYTLSTDAGDLYRALRAPGMKNGELKAVIMAWVARTEQKLKAAH